MKSSFYKKFTAFALAAVMTMSMSTMAFASTPASGGINVPVSVVTPVYNVTVPNSAQLAINPFSIATSGQLLIADSQIAGVSTLISNQTTAHGVKVTLTFTATPAGTVALVDKDADALKSGTSKSMYLAVVGANATEGGLAAGNLRYDPTVAGTEVAFDAGTSPQTAAISFALDKFTTALASGNIAGYTFYGFVNENPATPWAAGDMTIAGRYTLEPMNDTRIADTSTVGLNVIGSGWGFTVASFDQPTKTHIHLPFAGEAGDIDKLVLWPGTGTAWNAEVPSTGYAVNTATNTLSLWVNANSSIRSTTATQTYRLVATHTSGKTSEVRINWP
jgi:hypothetical protein